MDRELVTLAQHGDVEAFSTLTASRTGPAFAAARMILRDDDLAADAVQDAFVAAWIHLRGLRDPDRFEAWFQRLLVHACRRAANRRRRRFQVEIRAATEAVTVTSDAQQQIALRDQLERGFDRLSTDQRTVLVLRHYVGLSMPEMSEVLGVPLGTVQSRLNRAAQSMRAVLAADERHVDLATEVAR